MTQEQFETLLLQGEGEILDFKKEQYDFSNDEKIAAFVKDIISFANTKRKSSAYVIIGIEQTLTGKILHGLNKNFDDSFFQDKLKSKVYPIPRFVYYTFDYNGKQYGIFEIPLHRYPELPSPIVKLKGLEVGKVYMRRGSTNGEAVGKEIIQLDRWIQTVESDPGIKEKVNKLIEEINENDSKLSLCIAKALNIANEVHDSDLKRFCKGELLGWYENNVEIDRSSLPDHRKTKVMASAEFTINNISIHKGQSFNLFEELKNEGFIETNIVVQDPVDKIEHYLSFPNNGYVKIPFKMGNFGSHVPAHHAEQPVNAYAEKNTYSDIYARTKRELVRHLMRLK